MPAFWLNPNRSPLGLFSSISALIGKLPSAPGDRVLISKISGGEESSASPAAANVHWGARVGFGEEADLSEGFAAMISL
jgi:hypothetical protein